MHSFKFCPKNKDDLIALTNYNENFASVVNRENIIGVQFHPEKSQSSGLQLLKILSKTLNEKKKNNSYFSSK